VDFANVVTLEEQAEEHHVHVDVPDTRPEEELPPPAKEKPPVIAPPPSPAAPPPSN